MTARRSTVYGIAATRIKAGEPVYVGRDGSLHPTTRSDPFRVGFAISGAVTGQSIPIEISAGSHCARVPDGDEIDGFVPP